MVAYKTKKYKRYQDNIKTVVSYNLSWATQENKYMGSEKLWVKKCQQELNISNYNTLYPCTHRALQGIQDYNNNTKIDIIAIQEGTNIYSDRFFELFNLNNQYHIIKSTINNCNDYLKNTYLYLGISKDIIKEYPEFIISGELVAGRGYQLVLVKNTIIINAHFPHNIDIQELLNNKINPLIKRIKTIKRIIICGDFNQPINNLYLSGKNLKPLQDLITCCYPDYIYSGDYILDSNSNKNSKLSIIPKFNYIKKTQQLSKQIKKDLYFGSDHLPIVYTL